MKKISKIVNIALIVTIIGVSFWLEIAYPMQCSYLRPSLSFSTDKSSEATVKFDELILVELAKKIEKVREIKIKIELNDEEKEFFVTEWEEAIDWIFNNAPEIKKLFIGYCKFYYKPEQYATFEDFYYEKKKELLFINGPLYFKIPEIKKLFNYPVMAKLRNGVNNAALEEWRLKLELLHELLRQLNFLEKGVIIDLAQGANITVCKATENMVIGINRASEKDIKPFELQEVIFSFLELFGSNLNIDYEEVNRKLVYKIGDITKPEELKNIIEEVAFRDESVKTSPKAWFLNYSDIYAKFDNPALWVREMNSLIKKGDLIISGPDMNNFGDLFEDSGEYENISDRLPRFIVKIFHAAITEQFIVSTFRELQYIHPLRSVTILRKKMDQKPGKEYNALKNLGRNKIDSAL